MKIKPYVEKLNNSEQYQKFSKEYNDAFMVAGFFILDFEGGNNEHVINYYVPSQKKIAAFKLDNQITYELLGILSGKNLPEKLDLQTKIDLDALKGILEDEMKNRNFTETINKIFAVIQTFDGKKIWSINCALSGMHILKAKIEDESQTVLNMDKNSIFDYVKKMPPQELARIQQLNQEKNESSSTNSEETQSIPSNPSETNPPNNNPESLNSIPIPQNKEEIKQELIKLNQLEEEIELEKTELEAELKNEDKEEEIEEPKNTESNHKEKSNSEENHHNKDKQ